MSDFVDPHRVNKLKEPTLSSSISKITLLEDDVRVELAARAREMIEHLSVRTGCTLEEYSDTDALRTAHVHFIRLPGDLTVSGTDKYALAFARVFGDGSDDSLRQAITVLRTVGERVDAVPVPVSVRQERTARRKKESARVEQGRQSVDAALKLIEDPTFMTGVLRLAEAKLSEFMDPAEVRASSQEMHDKLTSRGGLSKEERAQIDKMTAPLLSGQDPATIIRSLISEAKPRKHRGRRS